MHGYNCTRLTPESFILNGVPGLEGTHIWPPSHFAPCTLWLYWGTVGSSISFILRYAGPCSISYPYSPSLTLFSVQSIVPKMLCIFWFDLKELSFSACLVQMFFLHNFTGMKPRVLMLMTLDHYVAICYPVCFATILTNSVIAKVGFSPSFEAWYLSFLFQYSPKDCPIAKAIWFSILTVTTRLWPSCLVEISRSVSSMV